MKIAIMGRPGVGKTTYAKELAAKDGLAIIHTDDYIGKVSFENMDDYLLNIVSTRDNYVVEGVQVARMLRTSARSGFPWNPEVIYLDSNVSLAPKHAGLSTLNRNCAKEWEGLGGKLTSKFNVMFNLIK